MIIDKERFLAQSTCDGSQRDPLLLAAMCAAGSKYSDDPQLCAEAGHLPTIGEQFMKHARSLLQARFDTPSIPTIQALLIIYWCLVQSGQDTLKVIYIGLAIRMAQEMGLNRPLDAARLQVMEPREVQIRKVIWWSCYQADRWTSATSNRPMLISDADCLVDYPASLHDAEDKQISSFCYLTDLAKILGQVVHNLYTGATLSACSVASFSQMENSLQSWLDSPPSAPSFSSKQSALWSSKRTFAVSGGQTSATRSPAYASLASPDFDPSTGSDTRVCYLPLYHFVRILLYQPFICGGVGAPVLFCTPQSSRERCRESAAVISDIARNLALSGSFDRHLFNVIYVSLCSAATVYRHAITSSKKAPSKNAGMNGRAFNIYGKLWLP